MASYREIKRRIEGVKNIQQITRAMKMVAAARLRHSEQAILDLRPFASMLDQLCARFLAGAVGSEHPFFERRPVRTIAVLAICSDRGLCGSYNNRVVEAAGKLIEQSPASRHRLLAVGSRGVAKLTLAGYQIHKAYQDVFNPVHYLTATTITAELRGLFLSGQADQVQVVFTEFFSPVRQVVVHRRLLPCHPELYSEDFLTQYGRHLPDGVHPATEEELRAAAKRLYIYEPDYEHICQRLLEHNLAVQVYRALLESQASEHGARMMAMDNATENADDMIEQLTLRMNRVRQENITREMLDVVGGAEAVQ